jgi:hypothetical protein
MKDEDITLIPAKDVSACLGYPTPRTSDPRTKDVSSQLSAVCMTTSSMVAMRFDSDAVSGRRCKGVDSVDAAVFLCMGVAELVRALGRGPYACSVLG